MPAKNKGAKAKRRAERMEAHRKRTPTGLDGTPQGKHLMGFKGAKVDAKCLCGKCHPNAKKDRVIRV